MENASNALMMAATILIGVMIISAAVFLFTQFTTTGSQISKQIYDTQIAKFNVQFTKYEGQSSITAYDIVSICNLAKQNNIDYYEEGWKSAKDDSNSIYYISVDVKVDGVWKHNYEQTEDYTNFIKTSYLEDNKVDIITFKCSSVHINENTQRVDTIVFEQN